MWKNKKIIGLIVLIVALSVFFANYQKKQNEIKKLNETLPENIYIQKKIIGGYEVVNNINNYRFKTPKDWKKITEIKYISEREGHGFLFSSINVKGESPHGKVITVVKFKRNLDVSLLEQANSFLESFDLKGDLQEHQLNGYNVVTAKEIKGLMGADGSFFQKEEYVYFVNCQSEDFIQEVIINGTW